MTKRVLIAIHGVGDSPPGATLLEISQGIRARGVSSVRADLVIDGVQYPRMTVEHPQIAEIIEINWSDVARPSASVVDLLDYLARIVVALLYIATPVAGERKSRLASAYRICFEASLVYCIYAPLVAMLWMIAQPRGAEADVAIGIAGTLVVAALTWYLRRFGGALWVGWLWAGVIAIATPAVAMDLLTVDGVVRTATIAYVISQVATSTTLFFAIAGLALRRKLPADQRIAGMALLYFPFFIISAIGAVIWAFALGGVSLAAEARFDAWQELYASTLESIGYDLALVEFTFASMVALVALGLVCVAVLYFMRARKPAENPPEQTAGELARNGGRVVLAIGAATFAALCLVYVWSAVTDWRTGWSLSALEVYSFSALRFLPYIPLMVGPLAVVAGIVVDILFYIVPMTRLSTAAELHGRLGAVLEHVRSTTGAPIVVAAHSQGTVIAVDVLGRGLATNPILLITAGSPVVSLYARFLGSTPEIRADAAGVSFRAPRWINFWREGDYIGAVQRRDGVIEVNLGRGGHTAYWQDENKMLWNKALEVAEQVVDTKHVMTPRWGNLTLPSVDSHMRIESGGDRRTSTSS
jgi:hypothetical protein